MRYGYTLLEMVAVLALLAVAGSELTVAARGYRDRAAVVGAREAVVGLVARARREALLRGAAAVVLSPAPVRASVQVEDSVVAVIDLRETFLVEVDGGGSTGEVRLDFGPLGLGRVASRTLSFRRGEATTALVVSSYGRVRRE
ncbi:MAG: prepilin-type N-terminal cleavage/methylation domain-containing protein [Gemmatimonadota bacterium]|nr:prepilin-type N-terminal cleavage/methylation domain-containing protein [Gemmatimonadota bacterium]